MSENTEPQFTLVGLAKDGYVLGLSTLAEVALNIELHWDLYWTPETVVSGSAELAAVIAGREADSIDKYLTDADKQKIDDEMSNYI